MPQSVAIVAVGTEITTGEIVNGNAAWLSEKMTDLGFTVRLHMTVPDDRPLMQAAFRHAAEEGKIILITGGLGPTSDDFTREEVAKFAEQKLEWDEQAWQAVVTRLKSVGAPVVDSNRQQCFFPDGCTVFLNSAGTASGFLTSKGDREIFVLPGPPNEISAIWNDHLKGLLEGRVPVSERLTLHRFICLGMSESRLGEIVEAALKGSNLLIGYRTRMPFVDVKVWTTAAQAHEFEVKWQSLLEAAIAEALFGKGDDDAAELFCKCLPQDCRVLILDSASGGQLAKRVFSSDNPTPTGLSIISVSPGGKPSFERPGDVVQITCEPELGAWSISQSGGPSSHEFSETTRYKGNINQARFRAYIAEKALAILVSWWR